MEKIEPFGYYCAACDGFTTDKRHAELYWNDYGHQPLYSQATVDQLVRERDELNNRAKELREQGT